MNQRPPLAKRKVGQHRPVWDSQPGAWGCLMGIWRQFIVPGTGSWCLASVCLAEPGMTASASEVLGLPMLFSHLLTRKETGSSQLETWILLRRLVWVLPTDVLPTDAVRPPGPMPVFYAMKMLYMCSAYCFKIFIASFENLCMANIVLLLEQDMYCLT